MFSAKNPNSPQYARPVALAVALALSLAISHGFAAEAKKELEVSSLTPTEKAAFAGMSPQPVRVYASFGVGAEGTPEALFYNAHPDSKLWFKIDAGKRHINVRFRIVDGAWKDVAKGDATDGVLFRISEVRPGAAPRVVFERLLNPRDQAADRGVQSASLDVEVAAGAELLFETTPGPAKQYSRDWAGWGKIEIR
jgi:hypothetical protein